VREKITVDVSDIGHYYLRDARKGTQKFCTVHYDNNFFLNEVIDFQKIHHEAAKHCVKNKHQGGKKTFLGALKKKTAQEIEKRVHLLQEASIIQCIYGSRQSTRYRDFAYQNDRGKPLTHLEVIKAYLMLNILLSGQDAEKIEQGH